MASNVLEELTKLKSDYDTAVKEKGRDVVDFLCKEFLGKHPEVDGVGWEAYTPWFNDGDACTFRIGEIYLIIKDPKNPVLIEDTYAEYGGNEDGYDSYALDANHDWKNGTWTGPAATLATDLHELSSRLNDFEDVLRTVFGDHVRVRVTKDGYDVSEYEHD